MAKKFHLYLKGTVGYYFFSPDQVNYALDRHSDSEVNVLINSLGGIVYDGITISTLFKNHGNVSVHFIGANASAATIAAMGAKRITMDSDALFLVHKCLHFVDGYEWMNEEQLEGHIAKLEKIREDQKTLNDVVAGMYARRCKKPKDELLKLMSKDTWMTAKQALEWGFIDAITDDEEDKTTDLSKDSVAAMAAAGLPLPPSATKKASALSRLFSRIEQMLSSAEDEEVPTTAENETAPEAEAPEVNNPDMYKALSAIEGVAVALTDGKASLTEEQLNAVEARLADLDKDVADKTAEIAEKTSRIAELEKEVADLRKEPAQPTGEIVESGGTPDKDGPSANMKENIDFLMSL